MWFFLPFVILIHLFLKNNFKNYFLLLASLLFYAWGGPKHLLVMLFSIALNYVIGLCIAHFSKKKFWLFVGIVSNLLLLGYFKYFNMLIDILTTKLTFSFDNIKQIALPIGISFYTFQALSYLIDLYRQKFDVQKNPFKLGLYISLFPQLIAGPIVQYNTIKQEIDCRTVTVADFSYGIKRFIYGFSKKMIFSNAFAMVADSIFAYSAVDISFGAAWLGAFAYGLQIYYDFSGYSDMAIGLGRMLGFKFLENFNYPYISSSITEFWRRWHISLSGWFKSYVYIPLGGNRKSKYRTLLNLMIVFALTGFWHGAAYQFIAWGLYFGVLLVLEKYFPKKDNLSSIKKTLWHIYTIIAVLVGWVLFRADDIEYALIYIRNMFVPFASGQGCTFIRYIDARFVLLFVLAVLLSGPLQHCCKKLKLALYSETEIGYLQMTGLVFLLVYSIMLLISNTYNPFIYFRF